MRFINAIDLTLSALSQFGENLRDSDVHECRAAGWRDPLGAVLEALHWCDTDHQWAGWHDDQVLFLGGLASCSEVDNDILLQPWMVAAQRATPKQIVRFGTGLVKRMEAHRFNSKGERRVFWNSVWQKAGASHRLIEHLGFRIDRRPESFLTHPKTGELFYPFES